MSNSVVKVTDCMLDDSLYLLVGADGTVSPDRQTVESYLNRKTTATNIQVMHINKSDGQSINVCVDNLTYVPEANSEYIVENTVLDEIAQTLHNVKLDHDYTPHLNPVEEVDELAKTLSILEGDPQPDVPVAKPAAVKSAPLKFALPKHQTDHLSPRSACSKTKATEVKSPNKISQKNYKANAKTVKDDDDDENDEHSEEDYDDVEDDSDSDFELEEPKARRPKKATKPRLGVNKLTKSPKVVYIKPKEPAEATKYENVPPADAACLDKSVEETQLSTESKQQEKKAQKKEKKTVKPIPDDFVLFSTPDIIRRVNGKDVNTPVTSTLELQGAATKPAKIENRSKSMLEPSQSPTKHNRLSLDGKVADKVPGKPENKNKPQKRPSSESPPKRIGSEASPNKSQESPLGKSQLGSDSGGDHLEELPSAEDIRTMMNEENKAFGNSLVLGPNELQPGDQNMPLDGSGLDLDPTLLENINNDLISEDILYQVAQSLVSNTELQNAIDKSLNEGNLVLDPGIQPVMCHDSAPRRDVVPPVQDLSGMSQKGTQIVRPDGRIVVIPPIERPTTRSHNRKKDIDKHLPKYSHKPLDEEHVSGNELDSSGEEEESEDDPNKLWCICNQPHNNRFMICCDTCEEWYHGKCVNITKAMGQQMESEGKEWICLFCKDPLLKRPQAAARRIRKASRNSRQSSDSASSTRTSETGSGSVPCVVCQKTSRINSIFCSEACILVHAQGVERVIVFERSTGNILTGNKAPSAANLEQWLSDHPGYEVLRSAGKIVTAKQPQSVNPPKLRLINNSNNEEASLPLHRRMVNPGSLKQLPKHPQHAKHPMKSISGIKIISKHVPSVPQKVKLVQASDSRSESAVSTAPIKVKTVHAVVKTAVAQSTKEKPLPAKTPKSRQVEQISSIPQPKQENIRENVQKTLFDQLTNRLKMIDDLVLTEDEVKSISIEIESQLYKCFGDTGQKYRNKYRSLIFNIKDIKNQTLWRRICQKSINPYQLVRLSPDDLASQELALWREREAKHQLDMIKKSELELLSCNRQYVLKTHKGEQILEDNRPTDRIDNTEVITSLTETSHSEKTELKSDSPKDRNKKLLKHSHRNKERKPSRDKNDNKDHHHHRSLSKDYDRTRRRSRSRDHNSKHSSRRRSRSRVRDRHRRSTHKSSKHKRDSHRGSSADKLDKKSKEILEQLVDNKIVPPLEDRLWKHVSQEDIIPAPLAESDSDHEPTSTVTIPTPPRSSEADDYQLTQFSSEMAGDKLEIKKIESEELRASPPPKARSEEIWRGVINMIDVAQISITAHAVSGDCNALGLELPSNLDIVGRISPDTVWDYIGKMKCSNSKIISLVRLNAINIEEKMPYLALYSYLSSRNRLGVVKSTNKAVKDFYILPLASQKPIPQALLPINGPGFEEARPALLLGIIVRDRRKRPLLDSTLPSPASLKKTKVETPAAEVAQPAPTRSYTPPPIKDPRLKLTLPPSVKNEDDEPYSPEDSDPDNGVIPASTNVLPAPTLPASGPDAKLASPQSFQPFSNKFDKIPGLDNPGLPSSTQEIQRQMEKLNKEIEMQKSEIDSISQNIATTSTEIGTSALANIALPSNLQQILDSIKTIGVSTTDSTDIEPTTPNLAMDKSSDLTIPLLLPTNFTRPLSNASVGGSADTIPLNLPSKKKGTEGSGVLSSLSEEDLIRKAAEMLGETSSSIIQSDRANATDVKNQRLSSSDSHLHSLDSSVLSTKASMNQPPVPGDEMV